MGSETEEGKKKTPVALAPIAKPLAGKKLSKKTLKLVRRGSCDCPRSLFWPKSSFPGFIHDVVVVRVFASLGGQVPEARGQGGGQEHPSWEQRVGISTSSR